MTSNTSAEWFARALHVTSGGVNSPARSFRAVGGDPPVVMARGEGPYLIDVAGQRYIDYLAAFGPLVLGHGHPRVVEAIRTQALQGTVIGTPTPSEIELAEELTASITGLDMVRLTSTGTEAVMSAIRLARAYTGRPLVVKFEGTYHGHSDAVLVKAGSGASTVGTADSLGIPTGVTGDVISLPYNDLDRLSEVMRRVGDQVACVLTEPIVGNMGIVPPEPGYLAGVKEITHAHGALLIFDEVITAFRFHYGTAAELLGVIPDLYVLGKIIGGGLPAGAYGGRRAIMEYVAPLGGMFQAGTFAGNPLSSAAGLATLRVLKEESPYARMDRLADRLATGILATADQFRIPVTLNRAGSGFTVFFGPRRVTDYETAQQADATRFARFHRLMLERGVYLAPSRFEAWFVSAQHTDAEIDRTLTAVHDAFSMLQAE
ncbi:glutamate-1-semialdehyde-2,1-aminomutase [Sulfobacillus acidophilus TPY]|uniref:Glutamate-1-semialdehyde 2,1-aminomutase n=1 Tax=Sulfobacillus acidophilus (strain ATCC 700253 / DSM 10332 / NAL) TaxID=679936 RepID=G8TWB0_SULAD|nr:glutamate-1-semialdehyde-2,1-aminomutase [Sulfobacillus acidophilus TPY]AEW03753.1 glutamate-1-semialdehyde 2,1-aminomutase [Sulfobacillus acidophilus DSM 10332]